MKKRLIFLFMVQVIYSQGRYLNWPNDTLNIHSWRLHKNTIISVSTEVQLSAVISLIGVRVAQIDIIDTVVLTGDIVIPDNINVNFIGRGYITGAHTFTIGKMFADPMYQIFSTSITVVFASGAVPAVRPEWWYDGLSWTKAIQKACNTGLTVKMSNRTYDSTKLTESISLFTDKQTILCDGTFLMDYRDFPLFVVGQTENGALPSSIVQFVTISGLNITGNKTTGSGAIYTRKTTRSSLNDFYIDGLDFGIAGDGKIGSHESLLMNFNRLQIYGCNVGVNDTAGSYQASTFYNCIIERNKYEGVITKSRNLNFIGGAIEGNNANNIYAYGDEKHAEVRLLANKGTCNFTDVYMESVSKDSIDCVIELADGEADAFPTLIIKGGIYSFNSSGSTNWYFLKNSGLRQWQIKINGAVLQATFKGVLNDLSGLCVLQINGAGMPGTVKIDSGLNLYQKYTVLGQFGPYGFDNRNQKARWRNNDSDPVSFSLSAKQGNSGFPVFKQEMQWDTNTIAKIEALTGNDTTNKTNGYMSFYTRDTLDTVPVERFRIKKNPYIPSNTRYFQHGQYAYYGIDAGASPYSGAYMYHDGTDWVSSHPTLRGSVLRNAGGYFYLQSADANTNPATGVRDHFLIDIINKSFVVYDTLTAANIKGVTKFINKTEATSTSTGSGQFDGGVSVDSSIWCGKYVMQQGIYGAVNIYDNSTAQSIPTGATYTKLTCFPSIGLNSYVTCDTANDKITFTKTGKYRVSATLSFSCGTNNVEWRVAGFLNNVEQNQLHFVRKIGTAGDVGNAGITGFINVSSAPWDLDLRARHNDGGSVNLTVVYGNLNVEYVGE